MSESLSTVFYLLALGVAAQGALVYLFFCCGNEDDYSLPVAAPPRVGPTSTTPLLYPSSQYNSYSRGQNNSRTPTTYGYHRDFCHSNRSPTDAGHSHRASSASAHVQPSHLPQPRSSSLNAQAAVKVKATREGDLAYRSDLASPHPADSHRTIRTSYASRPPQLPSSRAGQIKVNTTATARYDDAVYPAGYASHYVGESGQTPSSSTHVQPSHLPQPRSSILNAQAAAKVKTTREGDIAYRSDFASPHPVVSHETIGAVYASRPPHLPSTRASQIKANTTTTARYDDAVYPAGYASHYVGESGQTPSPSTHVQTFHLPQPRSSSLNAQATAKVKTTREGDIAYRSDLASPHPAESHGTIGTSYASRPPQLPPTRAGQMKVNTTTTARYDDAVYPAGYASHYVGESGPTSSSSTCAQTSYHQLPTDDRRVTEAIAKTQASPTTPEYEGYGYRPSLASSRVGESRDTFATPARTNVSSPPQLSYSQVIQSTASTTTPASHANDVHHSRLSPPYSKETSLTGLVPSPAQAAYQRTHTPEVTLLHASEYSESPTHSGTLPSSSGPGYLGTTSSTRVIPLSPSRVPNGRHSVECEADTTAEDIEAAKELRKRARRNNREMREARDLAKSARKRGDHVAEQRHRQDAIAHESEMKSLDKRAAKIFFRENNKAFEKGTVDLHGLYVAEAIEYAKKELQSATYRNDDEICFIVGKGLHSDGGQSKLRPHLQNLCDERRLTCSLDPKNAGKLRVRLK